MDDVVVYSDRWEDHVKHLREVLERLRVAGLTAKPSKRQLGMSHFYYLGYMVGGGVVKPDQRNVDVVKEFPTPQTKKQVRAFLGLSGYYRKFIPVTDLVRKDPIRWFGQRKVKRISGSSRKHWQKGQCYGVQIMIGHSWSGRMPQTVEWGRF